MYREKRNELILPGASAPLSKDSNLLKPRQEIKSTPKEPEADLLRPVVKKDTFTGTWNNPQDQQRINQSGFDDIIRDFDRVGFEKGRQEEAKANPPAKVRPFGSSQKYSKQDGTSLMEIPTTLCEVNEQGQAVVLVPKASLYIIDADNFQFYFEVFDENMDILYKRAIQSDLNYYVDDAQNSFKWVEIKLESGDIAVYACRIPVDLINSFKLVFSQCLYEATNQVKRYELCVLMCDRKGLKTHSRKKKNVNM